MRGIIQFTGILVEMIIIFALQNTTFAIPAFRIESMIRLAGMIAAAAVIGIILDINTCIGTEHIGVFALAAPRITYLATTTDDIMITAMFLRIDLTCIMIDMHIL